MIDMEAARTKVMAATRDIADLGGKPALMRSTEASALVAGVRQRVLQRHLDTLGPPGPLAFDPFERSFELRGHRFEADFVGSFGGGHWLWAWGNAFLPLEDAHTALSRQIRDARPDDPFVATAGLLCGGLDPHLVQHRLGSLALGLAGADAMYVANGSQCYALAAGQLPDDATLLDLDFALNDALVEGLHDAARSIPWAAARLGFQIDRQDGPIVLTHARERLTVELQHGQIARKRLISG